MRKSYMIGAALGLILALARPAQSAAQGFQVVANAAVGSAGLPKAQISGMFLKTTKKWPDGTAVQAVDLDKKSATREAFSKEVLGRPLTAIIAYWQQQVFGGEASPPPEKGGDAEVLAFVKSTPGAIGYVAAGTAVGDGVKVIQVQ
jgi:ABC-type phosphate transport system substrate-binding protein